MRTLNQLVLGAAMGVTLAASIPASAAVIKLGTMAADANNYGTFSGPVMQSVTLNGITYNTSELTQITLNSYATTSALTFLIPDLAQGASAPFPANPTSAQRRSFIESDWNGETGLINFGSISASFTGPVKNIAGHDMFIYEISGSTTSADPGSITINGTTLNFVATAFGDSGADTTSADILDTVGAIVPADLNALLTLTLKQSSNSVVSQNLLGMAIDFSDFGVALGDTVTSFTMTGSGLDPVIIAAVPIPEPASLGLLALSSGLMLLRRRHA